MKRHTLCLLLVLVPLLSCKSAEELAREQRREAHDARVAAQEALPVLDLNLKTFVCDKPNEAKMGYRRATFEGYLHPASFMACNNTCSMVLKTIASANLYSGTHTIRVEMGTGTEANQVRVPQRTKFEAKDVNYYDSTGKEFQYSQKVRITGTLEFSYNVGSRTERDCILLRPIVEQI